MEARLLADEQFDVAVSSCLRLLGHDVVGLRQLNENKSGDGWSDTDVVEEALRLRRIILTDNVKDFRALAEEIPWHEGIVLCSVEADAVAKANRIDEILRDAMRTENQNRLTGQVLDARRR